MEAEYPLGRICKVSDISEAISFLANDEFASFITEITLPVDGGTSTLLRLMMIACEYRFKKK